MDFDADDAYQHIDGAENDGFPDNYWSGQEALVTLVAWITQFGQRGSG